MKVALRNIFRHKGYSFLNILGLAIGMACFMLIFMLVQVELSYDHGFENGDDIFRVFTIMNQNGEQRYNALTMAPLASSLKKNFPEVLEAVSYNHGDGNLVKYGSKNFDEDYFCFTDTSFFKIFSLTFLEGNPRIILDDPYSVVLSEDISNRIFGNGKALGEKIQLNDQLVLTVTGVIKKIEKSHLKLNIVLSNKLYKEFGVDVKDWDNLNYTTYVLLQKGVDLKGFETKFHNFLKQVQNPDTKLKLGLQPLKRIYLHSKFDYDFFAKTGDINYVYILSFIGIFILLIACINFMNLTTARSEKRIKEVGLRKVAGAYKGQLVRQFLGESIVFSLIALLFALILVEIALPYLGKLYLRKIVFYQALSPLLIFGIMGVAIVAGIIAGSYPAFFLSSFNPAKILKGVAKKKSKKSLLRKFLVVGQFSFSIILIIATIIIYRQLFHMQNKDLGYDKEQLLYIKMRPGIKKKYRPFKDVLKQNPGIQNITAIMDLPIWSGPSVRLSEWEGRGGKKEMRVYYGSVDYDYFETFKIDIIEGRNFSRQYSSGSTASLIVNEEAVRQMEMEDPIGKRLLIWGEEGIIVGVVKNYNFDNVRNGISPLILKLSPEQTRFIFIRLKPGKISETIEFIKNKWQAFFPGYPFKFSFFDDKLDDLYRKELNVGKIISVFTCIAILISCLGLFGLASFTTEQRTKEISVRKVIGASESNIIQLLSKDFLKWVFVANIMAWPLGFWIMSKWLQNYAYRIPIGVWIFLLSGLGAMVIALITISFQTIRAANTNPVETLRYE